MIEFLSKAADGCAERVFARELSHRTANALQLAIAAVHVGQRRGADLDSAMDRLVGVAELNGLLTGRVAGTVDLVERLDAIGVATARSHGRPERVSTLVIGDELLVESERARPMLMAAAELVANSVRHAFANSRGNVTLRLCDDGTTTSLVVEDDGRCDGWGRPGGQGRSIVDALAAVMGGEVRRSRTVGGSSRVELAVPSLAAAAGAAAGTA